MPARPIRRQLQKYEPCRADVETVVGAQLVNADIGASRLGSGKMFAMAREAAIRPGTRHK